MSWRAIDPYDFDWCDESISRRRGRIDYLAALQFISVFRDQLTSVRLHKLATRGCSLPQSWEISVNNDLVGCDARLYFSKVIRDSGLVCIWMMRILRTIFHVHSELHSHAAGITHVALSPRLLQSPSPTRAPRVV